MEMEVIHSHSMRGNSTAQTFVLLLGQNTQVNQMRGGIGID